MPRNAMDANDPEWAGSRPQEPPDLFAPLPLAPTGPERRDRGVARVTGHNLSWVHRMRLLAQAMCRERGSVTADDLRSLATDAPAHPNAWGSIFRGKGWVPVGDHQMVTPSAHARRVRRWTWTEDTP